MSKAVFALGLAVAVTTTPAFAFGMLTVQGAHHESITRSALGTILQPKTLDSFAGKLGAAGAVGAPDLNYAFTSATHCDNGDFLAIPNYQQTAAAAQAALVACRSYLFDQIEQAVIEVARLVGTDNKVVSSQFPSIISCTYVGAVSGRAKCNALERLGNAMHTAQDFYAHTNWVDRAAAGPASATNPPGLGNTGASGFLASTTAPFPNGLISGCFQGIRESENCNGGPGGVVRVKHAVLNKDDPGTSRGSINDNFARARAAAVEETARKWAYFERRVVETYGAVRGGVMVCAMRTDNASSCSR